MGIGTILFSLFVVVVQPKKRSKSYNGTKWEVLRIVHTCTSFSLLLWFFTFLPYSDIVTESASWMRAVFFFCVSALFTSLLIRDLLQEWQLNYIPTLHLLLSAPDRVVLQLKTDNEIFAQHDRKCKSTMFWLIMLTFFPLTLYNCLEKGYRPVDYLNSVATVYLLYTPLRAIAVIMLFRLPRILPDVGTASTS